jgi:carboxyl-terminal processing protease
MERWQKLLTVVLAAVVAIAFSFTLGFTLAKRRAEDGTLSINTDRKGAAVRIIRDAYSKIQETSIDPPDEDVLSRASVRGMIKALRESGDDYAAFYSPQGYRDFQELTSGRFSGIGVWLKPKDGELTVVSVLPSSPALDAGLQKGDVITSINGGAVADMTTDEAVGRIKGREGTEVTIAVERDAREFRFEITRKELELPNIRASITGGGLGYLRLQGFARGAGNQLRDQIERFTEKGVEGILLDMRDNGGGLFSEAIDVASVFIEDGEIVHYHSRTQDDVTYDAEGDAFEELPLVVLVNEGTASASEIVAGALQDNDRAILVGTTTFGKGSVQEVVPLLNATAVKLTTAAYLTPDRHNIDGGGIDPDVEVRDEEDFSPDVQRLRAAEILKGIVLSSRESQG